MVNAPAAPQIHACPSCKSEGVIGTIESWITKEPYNKTSSETSHTFKYAVHCYACGYRGPTKDNEVYAIARHNALCASQEAPDVSKAVQDALHEYRCTYTVDDADPESGLALYDKLGPEELDLLEDALLGAIDDATPSPAPWAELTELEAELRKLAIEADELYSGERCEGINESADRLAAIIKGRGK